MARTSAAGGPGATDEVVAWRPPRVPGISEVLHASFGTHGYPVHTHSTWTLLIVDDGAVRYDLDRRPHGTEEAPVTLLPPGIAHDGRAASGSGFRKRVLYLDPGQLDAARLGQDGVGPAVDRPAIADPVLHRRLDELHRILTDPDAGLHAESRLALVVERLTRHLAPARGSGGTGPGDGLAGRLRELLDARTVDGVTLDEAGRLLHAHPGHLVRSFSRRFGLPPHRYLDARRVEHARALLLDGLPPAAAAATAGFHDQAHLHRRFVRLLGVTPGRYARSGTRTR